MAVGTRVVLVWADTVRIGRCRARECRARIFFAKTCPLGTSIIFTGDPVPLRTTVDHVSRRQIYQLDVEAMHQRTCPAAARFSSRRRAHV